MSRPRLLDLFCGAGGAAVGYARAGWTVVGVDIEPQPDYPYEFHRADAMTFPLDGFDAIHASPPCHDHSRMAHRTGSDGTGWMLAATIERLRAAGSPWVVENVPGAESSMGGSWIVLCGSMFGLRVRRHRLFASSHLLLTPPCDHARQGTPIGVYGHTGGTSRRGTKAATPTAAAAALGVGHTTRRAALAQMIPPAYTEHIGRQLIGAS